jgi:hypothetical protein
MRYIKKLKKKMVTPQKKCKKCQKPWESKSNSVTAKGYSQNHILVTMALVPWESKSIRVTIFLVTLFKAIKKKVTNEKKLRFLGAIFYFVL